MRLTPQEREALDRLASEQQVSVGELVRLLLAPHLARAERSSARLVPDEPQADPMRRREHEWLREHPERVAQLAGQWIVLEGDQLIAHGSDSLEVFQAARQAGIRIPFILRIPEPRPRDAFFIGL